MRPYADDAFYIQRLSVIVHQNTYVFQWMFDTELMTNTVLIYC